MSKKTTKMVDEMQARFIAVYGMSVVATLMSILKKSKLVGHDPVATDVHKFLKHHQKILNKLTDGHSPQDLALDEKITKDITI